MSTPLPMEGRGRAGQGRISTRVSESCGVLPRNLVGEGTQVLEVAVQVDTGRDFPQSQLGTGRHTCPDGSK